MKVQWYHHAVIYSLDVESFKDSNNDGIGDFSGLNRKLDYLAGLGVNCLWLRPFYPSLLHDDGYNIKDYYAIDPRIGNLGDFVDFIAKAKALGMKIITDLVVNHTSIEHEWIEKSRADKNSNASLKTTNDIQAVPSKVWIFNSFGTKSPSYSGFTSQ